MPVSAARLHFLVRPPWWVPVVVLALVASGVAWAVWSRPTSAVIPVSSGPGALGSSADREAAGSTLLERLTAGLEHGNRRQVTTLAAPGDTAASRELAAVFANVRAIGITGLAMRYVDEQPGEPGAAGERRLGGRGWVADVDLSWRMRGYDAAPAHEEVTLLLEKSRRGAAFVSARPDFGDPAPLWLLDRLQVAKGPTALVMVAGGNSLARFTLLADRAVAAVRRVLTFWHGRLVLEVPASQTQLDRMMHTSAPNTDAIAAVTTTVDGSRRAGAPVHVFVNPAVFDPLGRDGSQMVLSHETTHVATHAVESAIPPWLVEGFADYVALDHMHLPVSVTAKQVLAQVRRHGPPGHLPDSTDFSTQSDALGSTYEAAWLACRLIATTYGEPTLIRFYQASDRDGDTSRPFRRLLGTNQQAFTQAWRAYLRRLAATD